MTSAKRVYTFSNILQAAHPLSVSAESKRADVRYKIERRFTMMSLAMQDSEAIRNAVLRYGVSHPVINDKNMVLWRDLGVASWPTLMVVSPRGRVIATLAGDDAHG